MPGYSHEHADGEDTLDSADQKVIALLRSKIAATEKTLEEDNTLSNDQVIGFGFRITRWERRIAQLQRGEN